MDATGSTSDEVTIRLTGDEAFVLADALDRWENEVDRLTETEPAARRVFWDLTASLEPVVHVAFDPDYGEYLERARAAVVASP